MRWIGGSLLVCHVLRCKHDAVQCNGRLYVAMLTCECHAVKSIACKLRKHRACTSALANAAFAGGHEHDMLHAWHGAFGCWRRRREVATLCSKSSARNTSRVGTEPAVAEAFCQRLHHASCMASAAARHV